MTELLGGVSFTGLFPLFRDTVNLDSRIVSWLLWRVFHAPTATSAIFFRPCMRRPA